MNGRRLLSSVTVAQTLLAGAAPVSAQTPSGRADITPTDVYGKVFAVAHDVEQIRFYIGRPPNRQEAIGVSGVAPREVIYQAATLCEKVYRFSQELIREIGGKPAVPDKDIVPGEALNKAFPMQKNQNKFFTIWYGVYNNATHALTYGCGGHHAVLLFDQDNGETVEPGMQSFMIGMVGDADFESASVTVPPGSRLYVFSDGLFEINNPDKQMLCLDGLREKISQAQREPLQRLDAILGSVRGWQGFDDFADDYSLLEVSFS